MTKSRLCHRKLAALPTLVTNFSWHQAIALLLQIGWQQQLVVLAAARSEDNFALSSRILWLSVPATSIRRMN